MCSYMQEAIVLALKTTPSKQVSKEHDWFLMKSWNMGLHELSKQGRDDADSESAQRSCQYWDLCNQLIDFTDELHGEVTLNRSKQKLQW